jgi:two-component system invasion response regulator UvrY
MSVKLLIVDDQEIVRQSLALLFDTVDAIEVVGNAESGEQAIDQSQTLHPDVILMDLRMPGIGGLEATRQIHTYNPSVKIIILTALRDRDWLDKALEAGAAKYVQKDISTNDLIDTILGCRESV